MQYHNMDINELMSKLKVDEANGLSPKDYERALIKHGKNEITQEKRTGVIGMFLAQFKDFMIIILLISAFVSLGVSVFEGSGEYFDFFIILAIVLCNGIIGTVQEYKAEKAIEALKNISAPTAVVIRNGKKKTVDSRDLVVGDIVIIKTGDVVPADIRLIDSVDISCEESALTGESVPVSKDENYVTTSEAGISEQKNMLFASCAVCNGHGKGVVVSTGMDTQIGKIATMLQKEEAPQTPLQIKLNKAGKILGIAVIGICVIIFGLGLFTNIPLIEMMLISISLAVAAIPEGLTAVVTIVLSMGVKRMVSKKAIVRKLPAVETLGGVNVICSDKTGTLTENKMTVVKVASVNGMVEKNSGEYKNILGYSSLCNNAELSTNDKSFGMPTEIAIVKASQGFIKEYAKKYPRVGEIPFSSLRKIMTTVHSDDGKYFVITKGAPDYIIKMCDKIVVNGMEIDINTYHKEKIDTLNRGMAREALRVLAVAYKKCDEIGTDSETESKLCFCGLIGIEDPPRKEAKVAVQQCKKAGIMPVMITGDQVDTALAVATRIGIYTDKSKYMTGAQLNNISVKELSETIGDYSVFARVSPKDKVKIVRAFQMRGDLIAMTGDGVNDAPALKAADIGCAMGKCGTEVAKSAADMVLTDDNFATIVEAVREGRGIFSNIRKTIHFLLSCNTGEILLIFMSFLLGLPLPLLATQILWVNLVTDSLPALALGSCNADENIMDGEFKEGKKGIFSKDMCISMILEGAFIGTMSLIAFMIGRNFFDINPDEPIIGRTMCLAVLCFSQLVHSFNVSDNSSLIFGGNKNKWLKYSFLICSIMLVAVIVIPQFASGFNVTSLDLLQWCIVAVLSVITFIVSEAEKFFSRLHSKKQS